MFPVVMVGVMLGSYLVAVEGVAPLLTDVAEQRLAPGEANVLDMSAMGMSSDDDVSEGGDVSTDHVGMDNGSAASASAQDAAAPLDLPIVFSLGGSVEMAPATAAASGLRRADLFIDKMT